MDYGGIIHRTTATNTFANFTVLSLDRRFPAAPPGTFGPANTMLSVSLRLGEATRWGSVVNPHRFGVIFLSDITAGTFGGTASWAIFNIDGGDMPLDVTFCVRIYTGTEPTDAMFTVFAGEDIYGGDGYPVVFGNQLRILAPVVEAVPPFPAILFITPCWPSDAPASWVSGYADGLRPVLPAILNDHTVAVWRNNIVGQWNIVNVSDAPMPPGMAFFVENVGESVYESSE